MALKAAALKRRTHDTECIKVHCVFKPQGTCAAVPGLWFLKLTSLCWLQVPSPTFDSNHSPSDPFPPPRCHINAVRLPGYRTGPLFALRDFSPEHIDDTLSALCNLSEEALKGLVALLLSSRLSLISQTSHPGLQNPALWCQQTPACTVIDRQKEWL